MHGLNIYQLNENSITVEFGNVISEDLLHYITACNHKLKQYPFPGFVTAVSAYGSLTVHFDFLQVSKQDMAGKSCLEKVSNYLTKLFDKVAPENISFNEPIIEIPFCYHDEFGPDLNYVAQMAGMPANEVISAFTSKIYLVHMIGFVPGFAYMGGMDKRLVVPRKEKINFKVPAGSVGIAGEQTGVYPLTTPGGWQIIGRTPLKMFDINKTQPSYLKAGDMVKFKPISYQEFQEHSNADSHS